MKNTKNSASSSTNSKNDVAQPVVKSYICQKSIYDKDKRQTTSLAVLSSHDFKTNDWTSTPKFHDISSKIDKLPLDYPLKKTIKGNEDENRPSQQGKALRLSLLAGNYSIAIYTQNYGEAWKLSHTHTIEKSLFDAYITVSLNNKMVDEAEKESKSPDNFSLNLG